MEKVDVAIIGGSGYVGGELLRLLLFHPQVERIQITSESMTGKLVSRTHPNLRKVTNLKFSSIETLDPADIAFLCLPHGKAMEKIDYFMDRFPKIIDLSADFRLNDPDLYQIWYGKEHSRPDLLTKFVYGIPELHREEMKHTNFISSAGCNATVSILGVFPLYKENLVKSHSVIEVKVGSSEGGNKSNSASHHPERAGTVRSFKPTGHRHTVELLQELNITDIEKLSLSITSVDIVRGALATAHVFLKDNVTEIEIWKLYRKIYGTEPFIRIINEKKGIYRFPEPKYLIGTNYCDVGFEKDKFSNRLVVISAIDNLMKGAAGQAVQAFNIMMGYSENIGLEFPGLHPV